MRNKIGSMLFVAMLASLLSSAAIAGELSNRMAHGAIWHFMDGNAQQLRVIGVRELPQQNAAQADIAVTNWHLQRPRNDAITAYAFGPGGGSFVWSGRGTAMFIHYNDGQWMLESISIQPSTWNNLNIPVR